MGLIGQVSEPVDAPKLLVDPSKMTAIAAELARCGYDTANCARRLGVFPRLGVNYWPALRKNWTPDAGDPVWSAACVQSREQGPGDLGDGHQ